MGIPFYFKNLVNNFPGIVKKPTPKCQRLYLDYNCIVHQCASSVVRDTTVVDPDRVHDKVIQAAIDYIDNICNVCNPQELLFISVDGVCPRAKMSQQRKRRYMSVWQKNELDKERVKMGVPIPPDIWDSNIVTPGTPFMKKLDTRLAKYATDRTKGGLRVVCSPSSEMGEGEHKIVQHVRDSDNTDTVIYGLDADLILLSLILRDGGNGPDIRLLRERPEFNVRVSDNAAFCMLDIAELETSINVTFCEQDESFDIRDKVRDLVMLTTFVGNDFLPPMSYLKIKEGGLDVLIKAYDMARETCGKDMRLVAPDGACNWLFLDALLKALLKNEDVNFAIANDAYYKRRPYSYQPQDPSNPLWQKQFELDNYTVFNRFQGKIVATKPGWHKDYYMQLFGSAADVQTACKKYVDGLEWNFEYYLHGHRAPKSRWYYPYAYSPTIKDMSNYVNVRMCVQDYKSCAFEEFDYKSDLQLLMVLPPESIKKFLPHHADITINPTHGCMDMYPKTFKISTYLKHQLWECTPLLPLIDEERLKKYLEIMQKK